MGRNNIFQTHHRTNNHRPITIPSSPTSNHNTNHDCIFAHTVHVAVPCLHLAPTTSPTLRDRPPSRINWRLLQLPTPTSRHLHHLPTPAPRSPHHLQMPTLSSNLLQLLAVALRSSHIPLGLGSLFLQRRTGSGKIGAFRRGISWMGGIYGRDTIFRSR